ncbi:MAG TPA: DUF4258 domain-containing protein [Microvirga sp.]|jgi:hypothetical protein|nr:DUF4258 domain-containing protein [Microvirga sp.]
MRDELQPVPAEPQHQSNDKKPDQPPPNRLLQIIRFLSEHSERVIFGEHAQERMEERGITDDEVFTVLRIGELKGRITPGKSAGEWKCKVVAQPRGSRQMGVVTIIMLEGHLFIKTVEWEDR